MYVPPKLVTNKDLEKLMDTSDEWIRQRSGIEERHYVEGPEGPSDLALIASRNAIAAAGLTPENIDMIIFATLAPDYYFPGSACLLQNKLGLAGIPALDVRCQCTGFLYALNIAKLFVESRQYQHVLVVGAEVHSTVLDFATRSRDVTVLFGDGSGAVVVSPSPDEKRRILSMHLHADGAHTDRLCIKKPGTLGTDFISEVLIDEGEARPYMDGRYVFKHAVTRLKECVDEALAANRMGIGDVDWYLFHQANLRINESVANAMGIPAAKAPSNIQRYGNCSAASIPILLHETVASGQIGPGDTVCLAGFGAGFTWASAILKF
jgi:3-oxoacyl-[acyl-carrier-protein] synthase-3